MYNLLFQIKFADFNKFGLSAIYFLMFPIQATKMLRDMGVDCTIHAVTASNEPIVKEKFIEAGVDHFLTKPLNADNVASSLKNM